MADAFAVGDHGVVGPITALAFRATIDRPERFGSSQAAGPLLGLTPARYQSGETDIQGKVSRCGDELARTALYEPAHSLLVRSKKRSSLRAWGMNIASRTARWRTSGENLFVVLPVMAPPSQELEPPANPGRFISRCWATPI
jgi:hypothetical protein